jgi:hypothetical protein
VPFNSTFKNPGKGLKRSGFAQKPPKPKAKAIAKAAGEPVKAKPRARLKTSRPQATPIRQSARHETCTLRLFGVCKPEPGNVVWAHSNRAEDGKAGGLKADDTRGAYACYWCHCVYDRQHKRPPGMTLEYVEGEFTRGMAESTEILRRKGLLPA